MVSVGIRVREEERFVLFVCSVHKEIPCQFREHPCSKEKKEFRVSSEGIRVREEERFVLFV